MTVREWRWTRLFGSVRVRTTLVASLVVAAALTIGSLVLLDRFRVSLETNRRDAALAWARNIAGLAATGHLPPVLSLGADEASLAQVIDGSGKVLAASGNVLGQAAVGRPLPAGSGAESLPGGPLPVGQDGSSRLVAVPARLGDEPVTVYAAYSLTTSQVAVHDAAMALVVGLPLLVGLVAATTWMVVGRALRPIEAIRAEVTEISASDLHRRVPLPASADEVARLARTMNSMLDRLEVAVGRQRAFVADASHELRSPLTALRAHLEIGLAGGKATDWSQVADDALIEEARIERLTADLLALARLDSQTGEAHGHCDLAAVARKEIEGLAVPSGKHLERALHEPARVPIGPALAGRVIVNLVENAVRHARSVVKVCVGPVPGGRVELVVSDDGKGVPAQDRARVFERFVRLDEARSLDDGGAGLGLAIVHAIVTESGGSVAFTDATVGARVVVDLPALAPE